MRYAVLCLVFFAGGVVPAQAQVAEVAKFVGVEILKGVGSKLVEAGLDQLWGKDTSADQRVAELQGRLSSYESGLRQVDAKLADQVAALRRDLSARTTADDVRKIVKQTLQELEDRTGQLEYRQDMIDSRVRQIEDLFGYIPTVTPAPLLLTISAETEKPTAHPILLEWLPLLVRSEQSRHRVEELSRTLQPTSRTLKAELVKDREFVEESRKLHEKVMRELAAKLPDRQAVLLEYKPGTKEVRKVDESLATLTWLAAVTRPVKSGPYAGRLAVPNQLFGFDAPEVLRAFEISQVNQSQVIELYRQHFLTTAARRPSLGISVQRAELSPAMLDAADLIVQLAVQGIDLTKKVPDIDIRLNKARSEYADFSPQVTAIRDEQRAVLKQARELHANLTIAFGKAFEVYLETLNNERPTNSRMTAFQQGVLLPTVAWLNWLASQEDAGLDATSWQQFLTHRWGEAVTFAGHKGLVFGIAFSPDGSRIASGSTDKTVKIWDAVTGNVIATLIGHTDDVSGVAFSPDGSRIASGSTDKTVRIWDAVTGNVIATLTGHTSSITGVAFSPDGSHIASGSFDKTVRIWDAATGNVIATLTGHTDDVIGVAFSPDGSHIASGSKDNSVKVWGVAEIMTRESASKKE